LGHWLGRICNRVLRLSFFASFFNCLLSGSLLFFYTSWTLKNIAINVSNFANIDTHTVVVEPSFAHFTFNHVVVLRFSTETVLY
jgi:hypothetical protein